MSLYLVSLYLPSLYLSLYLQTHTATLIIANFVRADEMHPVVFWIRDIPHNLNSRRSARIDFTALTINGVCADVVINHLVGADEAKQHPIISINGIRPIAFQRPFELVRSQGWRKSVVPE